MRAVCDKKKVRVRQSPTQRQPRLWRLNYTLLFFLARRRASAIIRLVGTFDLGSSNSRYVSGTQRNAKHRGVVVRQSGRPASHAYGAFHYIKPFQCIIYFCVSHLRYGLCTGDGGQRALCNIADLKIAARGSIALARPVYIILTYDFSRKFCLPSHLYCDKPILHSAGPSLAERAGDVAFPPPPKENVSVCERARKRQRPRPRRPRRTLRTHPELFTTRVNLIPVRDRHAE